MIRIKDPRSPVQLQSPWLRSWTRGCPRLRQGRNETRDRHRAATAFGRRLPLRHLNSPAILMLQNAGPATGALLDVSRPTGGLLRSTATSCPGIGTRGRASWNFRIQSQDCNAPGKCCRAFAPRTTHCEPFGHRTQPYVPEDPGRDLAAPNVLHIPEGAGLHATAKACHEDPCVTSAPLRRFPSDLFRTCRRAPQAAGNGHQTPDGEIRRPEGKHGSLGSAKEGGHGVRRGTSPVRRVQALPARLRTSQSVRGTRNAFLPRLRNGQERVPVRQAA